MWPNVQCGPTSFDNDLQINGPKSPLGLQRDVIPADMPLLLVLAI